MEEVRGYFALFDRAEIRMNGLPKSPMKPTERDLQPLIGSDVRRILLPAKSDLSDWVDLMEVVEVLCPKWPTRPPKKYLVFRL